MFVGSTVQGSIGFGMGLLASPILILIDERFVPAPILLSSWVLTTFLVLRERQAIDLVGLRWAVAGRVAGTSVAGVVLAVLPTDRALTATDVLLRRNQPQAGCIFLHPGNHIRYVFV